MEDRHLNVCATDQPNHDPDEFAEKQRLGHGRGLQIKEVWIESKENERECGRRAIKPVAREAVNAGAGGEVCESRRAQAA